MADKDGWPPPKWVQVYTWAMLIAIWGGVLLGWILSRFL